MRVTSAAGWGVPLRTGGSRNQVLCLIAIGGRETRSGVLTLIKKDTERR
jgi:hypothetical protein